MFQTPADAYDRYIGRYSPALAAGLIDAAGVTAGQRALDVGAGPGGLTRALAAVLGAGNVAAVEPSEPFAAACRERVPGADVRVGGAEELPFEDASFDVVLSQLVVNFMRDAAAGVGEMRRVARPGGVVASATWDYAEGMTLLRRFWDAARIVDPEGAAARDEANFRYCRPDELAELWSSAGLGDVRTGELDVSAAYEDFDALWAPFEVGVGPAGAYTAALEPPQRAAVRDELRRALGAPAGPFALAARAWLVIGRA